MNETLPIRQFKFTGEISPLLYSDVSNPKYASSLRLCSNWFAIAQGALLRRPGTKFIAPVKDASYAPRLVKFVFSDSQGFLLEFGNLYVRFYKNGQYVGNDGNLHTYGDGYGGGYYELVTIFTTANLPYLKWAQVGDVITITVSSIPAGSPQRAPQDLRHTSGALSPWTIGNSPTKIPAGAVTWPGAGPPITIDLYGSTGPTTGPAWKKGERAFYSDGVAPPNGPNFIEWISIQDGVIGSNQKPPNGVVNSTGTAIAGNLWWMPAIDLAHPATRLQWVQTAVVQDAAGVTYESQPSAVGIFNSSLSADRQLPIGILTPTALGAGYTVLYYKLYRATAGGIFGWIDDIYPANLVTYTSSPAGPNPFTNVYLDDGRSPDFTRQPPKGTDPFLVSGADSYPAVVGYLDQRRLFASSAMLPSSLFLSKVGDLYNFDALNTPGADTDAMQVVLTSEVLEQIRAFVPLRRGLVLTSQGEWALSGAGGSPIARSNSDPKRQSTWGSSWLPPIRIGTGILYNTSKSNMVRELYPLYGLYSDIWDGDDLTFYVRHFMEGHTITDWDHQSTPYSIVWMARDDGLLLSMTYVRPARGSISDNATPTVAWAQHPLTHAFVEHVAALPEPPEDAVYVQTKRLLDGVATSRFIERLSNLIPSSDVRFANFLDMAVTYDGRNTGATTTRLSGGTTYAAGDHATCTASTPKFAAADVGKSAVVLDPNGTPVSARIIAFTSTTVVTVELDKPLSLAQIGLWVGGATTNWALAKSVFPGAPWIPTPDGGEALDSFDVYGLRGLLALSDGNPAQLTWASALNTLSLADPGVVVQIGIAYNSDIELLDAHHQNVELRNRFQSVKRVGFSVAGTRDLWVGKSFTSLTQWKQRQVLDQYAAIGLATGYFETFTPGGFDKTGRVAVRHFMPLPAILTEVLREVVLGDT